MALIRLCGHFIDNPNHIDKLICIKGLPDEWFFRNSKHGRELIKPWEADVEVNIPREIRYLCDPIKYVEVFPPIDKDHGSVVDEVTALGLRFNYMSEAGQTMWEKIERFLEQAVPRDQMIPKPVLVAPNQKSGFDPHEARRSNRGSLELRKADVPVIDLRQPEPTQPTPIIQIQTPVVTTTAAVAIPSEPTTVNLQSDQSFHCDACNKNFNERGLRMHNMKRHPELKKEPAGV